ncbi:chemotaxis protein CheW [Persicimonas caeni]|jgi:purine-binding chemotaxis protein CheW|uniref:Chemotaxis protein CheW n=1 Tax=Persicimonas caeni TaxID=2292766 RepID=A0A4Y6PZ38_PERCE|nr:chemotaxis protein CheW [Persicimonas caeni]QDG53581.1 chemotaxis protein CheW [Persicimonas caeni]QED34802.1 chemotaxis protein CheW [Persicimonas caeni]
MTIATYDNALDEPAAEAAVTEQYLTFVLDGEEYGVDILRVREIKGWQKTTPIPNTPEYLKGVINMRGTIVPIIDLRERFGLEKVEYGPTTVVIVLKVISGERDRTMGIVVDAVSDTYQISADQVQPAPEFGGAISVEFLRGLATVDEQMIILLDIDHLLNSGELKVMERAAQSVAEE